MYSDESITEKIPVKLPNGEIIKLEVANFGREEVSSDIFAFDDMAAAIEGITAVLKSAIDRAKPKKASVKFGLEASVESGKLAAVIVKGAGKANLEITLEWGEP